MDYVMPSIGQCNPDYHACPEYMQGQTELLLFSGGLPSKPLCMVKVAFPLLVAFAIALI